MKTRRKRIEKRRKNANHSQAGCFAFALHFARNHFAKHKSNVGAYFIRLNKFGRHTQSHAIDRNRKQKRRAATRTCWQFISRRRTICRYIHTRPVYASHTASAISTHAAYDSLVRRMRGGYEYGSRRTYQFRFKHQEMMIGCLWLPCLTPACPTDNLVTI